MLPDLGALAGFALALADLARTTAQGFVDPRGAAVLKADRSFVTALDLQIEAALRAAIMGQFPDHGILGEEAGGERLAADWVWVIDPIDGTAPFIAGVPVWGTLIALCHRGEPVIGIIDLPASDRRLLGVRGQPTTENGKPVRTSDCRDLSAAIAAVCNPDFFPKPDRPVLARLESATAWRIYGAACLSYAQLATGLIDLHVDCGFKPHDLMALRPVIEGAGGVIGDWQGRPITLHGDGTVLMAATRDVFDQARRRVISG